MRLELYIARRLRLSDNKGNRVKTSVRISTAGVVLSVVIMMITIAITSGFKHEIVNKLTGFDSQLTVEAQGADPRAPRPWILDADAVTSQIRQQLPDATVEESLRLPAMLKTRDDFSAVVFRGYGGHGHDAFIEGNIVEGSMPSPGAPAGNEAASPNAIIISATMANQLGLHAGDKVNTCFFAGGKMRLRNFEIAAVYNSGFGEYDKVVAYAPLSTLRRIAGLPDGVVESIEITGLPLEGLPQAQERLQAMLTDAYYSGRLSQYLVAGSIMESGAMYFNWLSLLNTNVVVILILMTVISSFTLIASLIILILERVNMIGTLKMLGATDGMIRRIFILLDLKVLVKGLAVGNVVALALILLQQYLHILPLDPDSYYISFVPVKISVVQVVTLNAAAIAVATLIMILPSMLISRLKPATILRYE